MRSLSATLLFSLRKVFGAAPGGPNWISEWENYIFHRYTQPLLRKTMRDEWVIANHGPWPRTRNERRRTLLGKIETNVAVSTLPNNIKQSRINFREIEASASLPVAVKPISPKSLRIQTDGATFAIRTMYEYSALYIVHRHRNRMPNSRQSVWWGSGGNVFLDLNWLILHFSWYLYSIDCSLYFVAHHVTWTRHKSLAVMMICPESFWRVGVGDVGKEEVFKVRKQPSQFTFVRI